MKKIVLSVTLSIAALFGSSDKMNREREFHERTKAMNDQARALQNINTQLERQSRLAEEQIRMQQDMVRIGDINAALAHVTLSSLSSEDSLQYLRNQVLLPYQHQLEDEFKKKELPRIRSHYSTPGLRYSGAQTASIRKGIETVYERVTTFNNHAKNIFINAGVISPTQASTVLQVAQNIDESKLGIARPPVRSAPPAQAPVATTSAKATVSQLKASITEEDKRNEVREKKQDEGKRQELDFIAHQRFKLATYEATEEDTMHSYQQSHLHALQSFLEKYQFDLTDMCSEFQRIYNRLLNEIEEEKQFVNYWQQKCEQIERENNISLTLNEETLKKWSSLAQQFFHTQMSFEKQLQQLENFFTENNISLDRLPVGIQLNRQRLMLKIKEKASKKSISRDLFSQEFSPHFSTFDEKIDKFLKELPFRNLSLTDQLDEMRKLVSTFSINSGLPQVWSLKLRHAYADIFINKMILEVEEMRERYENSNNALSYPMGTYLQNQLQNFLHRFQIKIENAPVALQKLHADLSAEFEERIKLERECEQRCKDQGIPLNVPPEIGQKWHILSLAIQSNKIPLAEQVQQIDQFCIDNKIDPYRIPFHIQKSRELIVLEMKKRAVKKGETLEIPELVGKLPAEPVKVDVEAAMETLVVPPPPPSFEKGSPLETESKEVNIGEISHESSSSEEDISSESETEENSSLNVGKGPASEPIIKQKKKKFPKSKSVITEENVKIITSLLDSLGKKMHKDKSKKKDKKKKKDKN